MMNEDKKISRRDWFGSVFMGLGLIVSHAVFAWQGLSFLLPTKTAPKTRKLFAGQASSYPLNGVKTVYDLQGNQILVKRGPDGFHAFSSVCPHLGCRVHWESDNARFFCPCHRGVFDKDGKAIAGPPADGGQNLAEVPLTVDEDSDVVYIEVKNIKPTRST